MRRLLLGFALYLAAAGAAGEDYPAKPVRLIVPFPPGGSTDLVARAFTPRLAERLGQQIVIEYKGGAAGSIGTAEAARATPDGYTLLIVWDTHAINHHVQKVQYDFERSFAPISLLVEAPGMLVAHPAVAASTLQELIDFARAHPGKVTVGMVGVGSSGHLASVRFGQLTGTQMTHVNYKGGGPLTTDILGGHVNLVFGSLPLWEAHVRSGKLKALAMLSKTRLPQFPDLPAANETVPGFELKTWFGLLAPAGTPRATVETLQRHVAAILRQPEVAKGFVEQGAEPVGGTPDEFAKLIASELQKWGRVAASSGVKLE